VKEADILNSLPAEIEWLVFFRISALAPLADERNLKTMFRLPVDLDLTPLSYVVLTSHGRYLAPHSGKDLLLIGETGIQSASAPAISLLYRHRSFIESFSPDGADCFAFGGASSGEPVMLHIVVKNSEGIAKARFRRIPSCRNYAFLAAIGVEYLGGQSTRVGFVAFFRNRLSTHFQAGTLADYSRTGNCNRFFLNHGEIDDKIERGLNQAAQDRIDCTRGKGLRVARELAERACRQELAMTCQPPPPRKEFPRGDLVPLGFLLCALSQDSSEDNSLALNALRDKLAEARQGALWGFHTGRLVTSTDSVLILQAMPDQQGIEALELFSDGRGGYFPQLWSAARKRHRMAIGAANAHWCQADFCLVRALRARAGLSSRTSSEYLERHFACRSGLFFANPYLTDWALALALAQDSGEIEIRRRLRDEILASTNADYSFGTYDQALSTSFAILALAELGYCGNWLRLAQLRLLEMVEPIRGYWPQSIPFYSTRRLATRPSSTSFGSNSDDRVDQIIHVNGNAYEVWWYRDSHSLVSTSAAVMALGVPSHLRGDETLSTTGIERHERYGCQSPLEYVTRFALPPYVDAAAGETCARSL